MNLASLMPTSLLWPGIGVIGLALFGAIGIQTTRLQNTQRDFAEARAAWASERSKASAAFAQAQFEARLEERRRSDAQRAINDEYEQKLKSARDDVASASAASQRLQQRIASLISQAGRTASNSNPVNASTPTDPTSALLADVFARIDATAGELAEWADKAHIAGQACEASYDALIKK